ncbi:dTDP-4-dehydrorhamnose 3,5-epimerase, partial [Candidatus Parcubacteria bacterium]
YAPDADTGIRWDSFGFDWPVSEPTLSERDLGFQSFHVFDSPFLFDGGRE